jgi:hypothetical protein
VVVCTTLAFAGTARADVINDWSTCAPSIIGAARAPQVLGAGPGTQLDVAMLHLAMHDAIQAYDKRFQPYAGVIPAGTGGSAVAAAARAAHTVLSAVVSGLPPLQLATQQAAIEACYVLSMTGVVLSPADLAASDAVGTAAGLNVLLARSGDGSFPASPTPFAGGTDPGEWRPNTGMISMVAPWLGDVRPYAIETVARCEPDDVPALTSVEYAEQYNEVKGIGSTTSVRTTEQGRIARMYSGNFSGQFNRLMRELPDVDADATDLEKLGNRGRLFALANTAAADAIICAWHAKKAFNFWRPVHGIRNGASDGNLLTEEDAAWTPYMGTPNYPDYTSGANNFGGSMTRALELFFGSDRPFDVPFQMCALGGAVPPLATDPPCRQYTRFSDIAKEIVDARIYLGIHFRFADTEARSQGRRAAMHTFKNILEPVGKK